MLVEQVGDVQLKIRLLAQQLLRPKARVEIDSRVTCNLDVVHVGRPARADMLGLDAESERMHIKFDPTAILPLGRFDDGLASRPAANVYLGGSSRRNGAAVIKE